MIRVEDWAEIRRLHRAEQMPIRAIARHLGISKNTVKRALASDLTFVFSIVAWLVYGYLSFSLMYRPQVRGRRAATLSTYGLGLIVVVFLVQKMVSPLHQ